MKNLEVIRLEKIIKKTLTQLKEALEDNLDRVVVDKKDAPKELLDLLPALGYSVDQQRSYLSSHGTHSLREMVVVVSWNQAGENEIYHKTVLHLASLT